MVLEQISLSVLCILIEILSRAHAKGFGTFIGRFQSDDAEIMAVKGLTISVLFFALSRERIFVETHSTGSRCYRTGKYTACMCVRASFSPEVAQAGAVKGLKTLTVTFISISSICLRKAAFGGWGRGERS